MSRKAKSQSTSETNEPTSLEAELASLSLDEQEEHEGPDNEPEEYTIESLKEKLEVVEKERNEALDQLAESKVISDNEPEEDEDDTDSHLYYEGIKDPEYRLKAVYVPSNARGLSKNVGYDPETGESYTYTNVRVCHKPPTSEHHKMEEFRVRLDSKNIMPAFVTESLGDRADAQDYFPDEEF